MNTFLTSNDSKWRLARTIVQGVIGVIIANLDLIVGLAPIPATVKPLIVALVMAMLSPIMAELGRYEKIDPDELYSRGAGEDPEEVNEVGGEDEQFEIGNGSLLDE